MKPLSVQVLRYEEMQHYMAHHDFFVSAPCCQPAEKGTL